MTDPKTPEEWAELYFMELADVASDDVYPTFISIIGRAQKHAAAKASYETTEKILMMILNKKEKYLNDMEGQDMPEFVQCEFAAEAMRVLATEVVALLEKPQK